jgi:ADP-heptose:LPS heptosyltransferase
MGDVALAAPALRGMKSQYPHVKITMVTRAPFEQFFHSIGGVNVFTADFGKRHKGLAGIIRLFNDLRETGRADRIIDLHDVIRTKILRFLFLVSGVPSTVIDKGRAEKRKITGGRGKPKLRHSGERYMDVFEKAGYSLKYVEGPWIIPSLEAQKLISSVVTESGILHIGVAPYSKHLLKAWPEEYMVSLVKMIGERTPCRIWLFGGKEETQQLRAFSERIEGSVIVPGTMNLGEELALMSRLDMMIAMDSSNMHMAALAGTRVISIWGATDPITGFGAWQQPDEYSIRLPFEELGCRPCSVYGKGKCRRGDFACMMWLTPEKVFESIISLNVL